MTFGDIIIILAIVFAVGLYIAYKKGKKNYTKNLEAQSFINQYKQVAPVLIIDEKFERPTEQNLPKNIYEKLPKSARLRKMPIVKGKVGSQVMTLMCDKNVYDVLIPKKTMKVEIAGIYITKVAGMNLEDKKNKTFRQKLGLWMQKNRPNL